MAGQSEASDDLIAELAKLMAQDAQVKPAPEPVAPAFSVRIPGGDSQPAPATPAADFVRQLASEQPAAPAPAPVPPAQPQPYPSSAVPVRRDEPAFEPFNFDFDLGAEKPQPAPAPVAARPEPVPVPRPAPAPAAPRVEVSQPTDHDSIADLIAAELAVEPPFVAAPTPAPTPAPAPVPPQASQPAPAPRQPAAPAPSWAPTPVAPNLGGQDRQSAPGIRPVNLQPTPRPEQDRFKVPPVFGLGTTPAQSAETIVPVLETAPSVTPVTRATDPVVPRQPAPAPVVSHAAPERADDSAVGLDPIDEIESLIGRAMRVEFDKPVEPEIAPVPPRPAPSPALRSLATPTLPPEQPSTLSAADETIFAAARATGAEIGWVDTPDIADEKPAKRPRERKPREPRNPRLSRSVAGPLVAVGLLLAAGFGLYWVLGLGGRDSGPAPLLEADATPTKQDAPAIEPGASSAQQSVVFNEIDGVVPGAEEQIVSRDQSDVNEVTQVAAATPDLSEEGLANRKVRTVTVRPDGSIVSGDDSVAGSTILPVDRPTVPAVPGTEAASPELQAAASSAAPVTTPAAIPAVPATPAVTAVTVTPVQPGSTVPVVDLAGNPVAGKTTVVPRQRPAGLSSAAPTGGFSAPTSPVNAVVPVAAPVAQPGAIPAGATEVAALANNAPAYVQLASQRTEAEARQTAQTMVSRFGPLFGGANMEVQRVDLGAKGVFYRVRVPAGSLQDANTICSNVKAAGGDCLAM